MATPLDKARGPAIGLLASIAAHVIAALALWYGVAHDEPTGGEDPFAVDVELAPAAPEVETLPEETVIISELVTLPPPATDVVEVPPATITPPPPPPETQPEPDGMFADAGVPDAPIAPDAGVEPPDAGNAVATATEVDVTVEDRHGGDLDKTDKPDPIVPSDKYRDEPPPDGDSKTEAGDADTEPVSAGTAANLLAFFPKNHLVTVLVRFDRLRGTEWAKYTDDVLSNMPDHETLIGNKKTKIADKLDLIAVSTPRPNDINSTVLAMKPAMTAAELRDFLDEPGAPVSWSRVVGGVLGTRGAGDRVYDKDTRVFLAPSPGWMVLAKPKDLPGLTQPADGELDDAVADPAVLPPWLQRIPELIAESGEADGPVIMMTMAPRQKAWEVPDLGLGFTKIPAPKQITFSLILDAQGFVIKGNLVFEDDATAEQFVALAEGARQTVVDTAAFKIPLKRAHAYNGIVNLSLKRTKRRVAYATSVSIADGRALLDAGADMVRAYFQAKAEELEEEAEKAEKAAEEKKKVEPPK